MLSFCKLSNQTFPDHLILKCAVYTGENPLTFKEDASFDKCAGRLFGDFHKFPSHETNARHILAQISTEKVEGINAKNFMKSSKVEEALECSASKKCNSTEVQKNTPAKKILCFTRPWKLQQLPCQTHSTQMFNSHAYLMQFFSTWHK